MANKAELILDSNPDDTFLEGHCSACKTTKFRLTGNTMDQKTLLRSMYDSHFRRAHSREDADNHISAIATDGV